MKSCILTVGVLLGIGTGYSQTTNPPAIEWQASFGGILNDQLKSLQQTTDNGIIAAGFSSSPASGNKTSPLYGVSDFWVVRLDANHQWVWDKAFAGNSYDSWQSVQQTPDAGFILGGFSNAETNATKTAPNFGGDDFWIVRLDSDGNQLWDKSFGGSQYDILCDLKPTTDGGFLLAGYSNSGTNGNKTSPNLGAYDFWIVRVDSQGSALWDRTFGGTGNDLCFRARQTLDGGFILGGHSDSGTNGNKTSPNFGGLDFWIVRLNADGTKLWDKSFGGLDVEELTDLQQTADGGFILGGTSRSLPGGNKTSDNYGTNDFWVVRLDAAGNKLWDASFGGQGDDQLFSLAQTRDGGFILGGISDSPPSGNKTSAGFGYRDMWVVRLAADGRKLWDQAYGGSSIDGLNSLQVTRDGGYLLGGFSKSPADGNKTSPCLGSFDYWLVKLAPDFIPIQLSTVPQTAADIAGNGYKFKLTAPPNRQYVTEYSVDGFSWTRLQTNLLSGAEMEIVDRSATNAPMRLYRVSDLSN